MTANSSHFHPEKWGYGTISPKNEGYRYPSYPKDCADEISSQVLDVDTCVLDSITASDDDALWQPLYESTGHVLRSLKFT